MRFRISLLDSVEWHEMTLPNDVRCYDQMPESHGSHTISWYFVPFRCMTSIDTAC